MPKSTDPNRQFERELTRLLEKRRSLVSQLETINGIFERFGIEVTEKRGRGRPPKAPGQPKHSYNKRPRGKFGKSGNESVLDFLAARGDKGATTAEVNANWKSEGRAGDAYVTLGHLVNDKKIKKENIKGKRGSRYYAL